MNTPNSWPIRVIVALVALLLFAPLASHADTYSIVASWSEHAQGFTGIDPNGNVYFMDFYYPYTQPGYKTNILSPNGSTTSIIANLPYTNFVSDRGSSCSMSVSGFGVRGGICNGSLFAFLYSADGFPDTSLYLSSGSGTAQLVTPANHGDLIAMNSLGDIVFDDGLYDIGYYAVDLDTLSATPEPSSLILLATGALALAGFVTFRRNAQA